MTDEKSIPHSLPFDLTPPSISITGESFCFTGKFDFGSKKKCEEVIGEMGGTLADVAWTKFLVVGAHPNKAWKH